MGYKMMSKPDVMSSFGFMDPDGSKKNLTEFIEILATKILSIN